MNHVPGFHDKHPNGITLMARDNPENRKLFPNGPWGYEEVDWTVCSGVRRNKCPHYNFNEDDWADAALQTKIHVLIAAYRDKLCARTLHNAFTRAANPYRLFIRVIDQTQPDSDLDDDEGCWQRYCSTYNSDCKEFEEQVRVVRVDSALSKGPTWARSKLSAMVHWDFVHQDEPKEIDLHPVQANDFCMQIDSHMDFSDHFDQGLIDMHHRTKNDYAVLSTYVTDIEHNDEDMFVVPNLCMVKFTSSIRNWGTKECKGLKKPKLTNAMWGAGLSFHRCHGEVNVPVDPYLDNVFDGEEGSRGIRFFTHGYDVYTPDKVLVTHDYHGHQSNPVVHTWGRKHDNKKKKAFGTAGVTDEEESGLGAKMETSWKWMADIEEARQSWKTFGSKRVNMVLGIGSRFDSTEREIKEVERIRKSRFGLGNKRTLSQARVFTGINLLEEKMEVNKCGNLLWVPYRESPNYGLDETLARTCSGEGNGAGTMLRMLGGNNTPKVNSTSPNQGPNKLLIGGLLLLMMFAARYVKGRYLTKAPRHND